MSAEEFPAPIVVGQDFEFYVREEQADGSLADLTGWEFLFWGKSSSVADSNIFTSVDASATVETGSWNIEVSEENSLEHNIRCLVPHGTTSSIEAEHLKNIRIALRATPPGGSPIYLLPDYKVPVMATLSE